MSRHSRKQSQNFNLVDVGAVLFAGPAGLAVTKGSDYTFLMIKSKGNDSTVVNQFVSEWGLKNGRMQINDLAMSTGRSRIASLDITISIGTVLLFAY